MTSLELAVVKFYHLMTVEEENLYESLWMENIGVDLGWKREELFLASQ